MIRRFLLCAAALVMPACATVTPAPLPPPVEVPPPAALAPTHLAAPTPALPVAEKPAPTADDDAIREAVFRHLFQKNASGQQQSAKVYCLKIEGEADPSDALLARFQGNTPPVKKQSRCKMESTKGVFDIDTGERGLIFRVDAIEHTGKDTATVRGGYYEAGLSSSGNVYSLARENGEWVVKNDKMLWISSMPIGEPRMPVAQTKQAARL